MNGQMFKVVVLAKAGVWHLKQILSHFLQGELLATMSFWAFEDVLGDPFHQCRATNWAFLITYWVIQWWTKHHHCVPCVGYSVWRILFSCTERIIPWTHGDKLLLLLLLLLSSLDIFINTNYLLTVYKLWLWRGTHIGKHCKMKISGTCVTEGNAWPLWLHLVQAFRLIMPT